MSHRMRDLALLFGLGFVLNGIIAALVSVPGYVDAYYYFNAARFLADGHGFNEPYLWCYLAATDSLPAPAFTYWQPLASVLAAVGISVLRWMPAFGAAQVVYVLLAACLPVVTYLVAVQVGERRHGLLAGLLMVFSGAYVVYWSLPETFTPFALSAGGALALAGAASLRRKWWLWLVAGVSAGLAHLTRADGVLVIAVVAGMAFVRRPASSPPTQVRDRQTFTGSVGHSLACLAGYGLVMVPWLIRGLMISDRFDSGGLSTLWMVEYNDLFTYPIDLSLERFFNAGIGTMISARWTALIGNAASFVGIQNLVFLTPLTLIGLTRRWRSVWFLPAAVYGLGLFTVMTLAFPFSGVRGGYFHSSGALLPCLFSAAALGLDDVLRWAAARRGWRLISAQHVFFAFSAFLAAIVTGYFVLVRVVGLPPGGEVVWNQADAVYGEIGQALDALGAPPDARVMSANTPGFYYYTGRGGVPLPRGDEEMLLRAARDFGTEYLVVDRNVAPGLESLYDDGPQTAALTLLETFEGEGGPIYLYHFDLDAGE